MLQYEELLRKEINIFFKQPYPVTRKRNVQDGEKYLIAGRAYLGDDADYDCVVRLCTLGVRDTAAYSKSAMNLYIIRAAALQHLHSHEESLKDIERAIALCDDPLLAEYFHRKKRETETIMESRKPVSTRAINHFETIPFLLSTGEGQCVPSVSNAVRLFYSEKYGHHFKATKPISTGDIIMIDKSLVSVIDSEHIVRGDGVCSHCLRFCRSVIPCHDCCCFMYCSIDCREKAYDEYHRYLCTFASFRSDIQFVILLLYKVTENGDKLDEAVKYCEELDSMDADTTEKLPCDVESTIQGDLKTILNLSAFMEMDEERTSKRACDSALIATVLRNKSNLLNRSNDVIGLSKLVFHLFYVHDKYANTGDITDHDSKDIKIHTLFPLLKFVWHSCSPNAISNAHAGHVLALRAAKNIKPDEMITINFFNKFEFLQLDTTERQSKLKKTRFASCNCEACVENYTGFPTLCKSLNIPRKLQRKLRRCPTDIECMWKLLKIINGNIEKPSFEAEVLKLAISNAYQGKEHEQLEDLYKLMNISQVTP